ncbi:hypothetical protein BpHYR1_053594 [Brachionus plicatilis]|uniref:SWIM-type domain-containing protein n=1 Tax=Brachionus plicatilis TaxID=10195 RepID=A0A3M7QYC3_BRAPC|nr:hypothetical protein BpHYR1_053594 [Brachionus plicatilis]
MILPAYLFSDNLNELVDNIFTYFVEIFPIFVASESKSRFTSQSKHNTWLKYSLEAKQKPILGWFCDCKSGSRVFGACAHNL